MKDCEDRCVNVPSWSLPVSVINAVSVSAEKRGVSQSQIVREALQEKLNPIKNNQDMLQCEK